MAAQNFAETGDETIPLALRRFVRRRIAEALGLAIVAAIVVAGLALASWSVNDPSFNHATDVKAQNWLGSSGATMADGLMQFFGLASLAVLFIPLSWALRLLRHEPMESPRAIYGGWIAASLALAAALSLLPIHHAWPLAGGYGGNVGDVISGGVLTVLSVGIKGFVAQSLAAAGFLTVVAAALPRALDCTLEQVMAMVSRRKRGVVMVRKTSAAKPTPSIWARLALPLASLLKPKSKQPAAKKRLVAKIAAAQNAETDVLSRFAPLTLKPKPAGRKEPQLLEDDRGAVDQGEWNDTPVDDYVPEEEDFEDEPAVAPVAKAPSRVLAKPVKITTGSTFELPSLELLAEPKKQGRLPEFSPEFLADNARRLEGVLEDFGVKGQIINVRPGPVVTLYELEPAPGIKSSRVISLADDIARSMSAISARVAVVAGRNAIGIELPNPKRETVYLRELMMADGFIKNNTTLSLALGKNIGGEPIFADLARMPHLLIAGTTGSGKSVGINTMILSLLYRLPPDKCKLIMIDPKMLELSVYEGIPHLLAPVVTDPRKAVVALKWAVREMEDRYKKMSKTGVRNIDGYNAKVTQMLAKGAKLSRTVQTGFDAETGQPMFEQEDMDLAPLPYIVVIIDEMADLMMVAGKDIEGAVQRLAQMARAAGIHVVMATQRPSVDVITGTIKANFPTRISFQVTSKIDSRTILGEQGAEQLLGQGDMLYMAGGGRISRLHAPFVTDTEVEEIVNHLKAQGAPEYVEAVTEEVDEEGGIDASNYQGAEGGSGDDLYDQAVAVVLRDKKVSTSYVQRRLQVGYNKAASLIERMEKEGVISAANATGKREILVPGDSARI